MSTDFENAKFISMHLHKLASLTDRLSAHILKSGFNLSFPQFFILMALKKRGDISQTAIAQYHGLTESAISKQIAMLQKIQFLRKTINTRNRREHILQLTPKGSKVVNEAMKKLGEQFVKIFNVLPKNQQKLFGENLEKITVSADFFVKQYPSFTK